MLKQSKVLAHFCLIGLFVLGTGCRSLAQNTVKATDEPSIPQTPIGKLLNAFIDAVNSGDAMRIDSFVAGSFAKNRVVKDAWPTACCVPDKVSRTLFNVAKRSGGLTLKEVHPLETEIVAFVQTKNDGKRVYIDIKSTAEAPDQIDSYQLIPVPADTEEFVPKITASTLFGERLEMARQALKKAAARDLFSGTLLVARNGKALLSAAYGEADKESHVVITMDTPFGLASTGKLFTAVAVAQLVSQGKLSYDEPILGYLPDYPNKAVASKITLRQLLTHTSGLADIFSKETPKFQLRRLRDYYPLFANDPLLFEPGKGQSYSNTGFLVASMIVEQSSGQEFRQYLREHVFQPAGMTATGWGHPKGMARPYTRDDADDPLAPDSPWVSAEPFYKNLLTGPAAGPGGEYSTVGDLLKFATALQNGKLLNSKEFNRLIQEGYGCQCSATPGHRVYAHPGGGPGVNTGLKLYVDQNFVAIFLSNYDPPFPQLLASSIGDLLVEP